MHTLQWNIPVRLTRPVESTCMLLEPVMSLSRAALGLEIPLAVVSSQSTTCRVINPTDTPISIPAGCAVALARNIVLSSVTEMIDFFQPVPDNIQVNTAEQAHDEGQSSHYDFNKIMPFPVSDPEDVLNFNINNPKLSAQETAELIAFLVKNKQAFASTLAKLGHSSEYFIESRQEMQNQLHWDSIVHLQKFSKKLIIKLRTCWNMALLNLWQLLGHPQ